MMALVHGALRREVMVNKQPLQWVSDDTLRRITGELGNVSDALPDNLSTQVDWLMHLSKLIPKWIVLELSGPRLKSRGHEVLLSRGKEAESPACRTIGTWNRLQPRGRVPRHCWPRRGQSDDEHHALAAVQARPEKARRTCTKESVGRVFVAMELADCWRQTIPRRSTPSWTFLNTTSRRTTQNR